MTLDSGGWYRFPVDGGRVKLECDFGAGWVNLTGWWTGLRRVSGRAGPLDRFNASTLTFNLDNRDREWTPWRTGPHGKPDRNLPVRLQAATPGGLVVSRFVGWTSRWQETAFMGPRGVEMSSVEVSCVDGFRRLARANGIAVTPVGDGESSGDRINRILNVADWPVALRRIDAGVVTMAETDMSSPALDELLDTALADGGVLFIDGDGYVVFYDRATLDADWEPEAVLGSAIPTGVKRFAADDSSLVNTVRVARAGGTEYTAFDDDSKTFDGPRLWTRTNLPLETDAQAEALAPVLLSRAISSVFLPGPLELLPITGGSLAWDAVVRLGVTAPISVAHFDQVAAAGFTVSTRIDGITDDVEPGRWVTTYSHSPLDEPGSYTVVGPPTGLACTPAAQSITWTWTIPVHGYDILWVKVDSGEWIELGFATTTFTVSGLTPNTSHTLCVRGRLDFIDSDEACTTCTTLDAPGPPDPGGGGGHDIPDPPEECETPKGWAWRLDQLIVYEWTEQDEGLWVYGVDVNEDWRPPDYTFVPGQWYRITFQLYCDGAPEGDPIIWEWQEPADWEDACDWPDPPTPAPVFMVEVCASTAEIRDVATDTLMFQGPLFDHPVPGPFDTDVAILVGTGFDPAKVASAYLDDVTALGLGNPIPIIGELDPPALTVGLWVNFDSEPTRLFPLVRVGTVGSDSGAWSIMAEPTSEVGEVEIGLSVAADPSGRYEIDFDTVGTDDHLPIIGWHSIAVTWGNHGAGIDPVARLYFDGAPVSEVELPADWTVRTHDALLEWQGEPNSMTAHLIGWDVALTAGEIEDIFTPPAGPAPYDDTVVADGPKAYWPLAEINAVIGSAYDIAVASALPKAYWICDVIDTTASIDDYDASVLASDPYAYWELGSKD